MCRSSSNADGKPLNPAAESWKPGPTEVFMVENSLSQLIPSSVLPVRTPPHITTYSFPSYYPCYNHHGCHYLLPSYYPFPQPPPLRHVIFPSLIRAEDAGSLVASSPLKGGAQIVELGTIDSSVCDEVVVANENAEIISCSLISKGPRFRKMIGTKKQKMKGFPSYPLRVGGSCRGPRDVAAKANATARGARWVRKSCSLESSDEAPKKCGDGSDGSSLLKTSVMIKNIPNKLRRRSLIDFLDGYCKDHSLEYDFLYLPMDFRSLDNYGYAFVNFTNAAAALKIRVLLHNFKWELFPTSNKACLQSKKICEVTWAKIQGKEKLMRHFQGSSFRCHTDEYLPAVFNPPRNGSTSVTIPKPVGIRGPAAPRRRIV